MNASAPGQDLPGILPSSSEERYLHIFGIVYFITHFTLLIVGTSVVLGHRTHRVIRSRGVGLSIIAMYSTAIGYFPYVLHFVGYDNYPCKLVIVGAWFIVPVAAFTVTLRMLRYVFLSASQSLMANTPMHPTLKHRYSHVSLLTDDSAVCVQTLQAAVDEAGGDDAMQRGVPVHHDDTASIVAADDIEVKHSADMKASSPLAVLAAEAEGIAGSKADEGSQRFLQPKCCGVCTYRALKTLAGLPVSLLIQAVVAIPFAVLSAQKVLKDAWYEEWPCYLKPDDEVVLFFIFLLLFAILTVCMVGVSRFKDRVWFRRELIAMQVSSGPLLILMPALYFSGADDTQITQMVLVTLLPYLAQWVMVVTPIIAIRQARSQEAKVRPTGALAPRSPPSSPSCGHPPRFHDLWVHENVYARFVVFLQQEFQIQLLAVANALDPAALGYKAKKGFTELCTYLGFLSHTFLVEDPVILSILSPYLALCAREAGRACMQVLDEVNGMQSRNPSISSRRRLPVIHEGFTANSSSNSPSLTPLRARRSKRVYTLMKSLNMGVREELALQRAGVRLEDVLTAYKDIHEAVVAELRDRCFPRFLKTAGRRLRVQPP